MTPTPEQIKAAMPAMREWCSGTLYGRDLLRSHAEEVAQYIDTAYPGGVAQFLADQPEPSLERWTTDGLAGAVNRGGRSGVL